MRLPSPGLHCLRCEVPSVHRGVHDLADVSDVRQGCFTRCRWHSRFRAGFGAWRSCRPARGRRLLTSSPQTELARKYALHQGEEVGHDIAHGAALAACLQLIEYFLAMLRRQPPQGGLHIFLLMCLGIAQARRQAHRMRCRMAVAFARAVRTFFFIHIRLIRTARLSCHVESVPGLLRNKRAASGVARQWQWVGCLACLRRRRRGQIIVIVALIVGRNGSGFRCLRQRCLNVDSHPIYLVVFVADRPLQKRGQTGIECAGLLEVQGTFVNLIQFAEHMAGKGIALLAHQTDPPRQPKHDENAPGRLVPGPLPQRGRGEIAAQLPQVCQRTDALGRAQHLPAIALQRREAMSEAGVVNRASCPGGLWRVWWSAMRVLQGMGHSGPFPCISSRTVPCVSQQCGLRHTRFIRQAQRWHRHPD